MLTFDKAEKSHLTANKECETFNYGKRPPILIF